MSNHNAGAVPSLTSQRGFGAPPVTSAPSQPRSTPAAQPTDSGNSNAGQAGAAEAQVASVVGRVNGGVDLGSSTPAPAVSGASGGTAASVGLPGGLGTTAMVGVQSVATAGGADAAFNGVSASSLQNVANPSNVVNSGLETANAQISAKQGSSQSSGQQVEDTEEKKGGGRAGGKRKGGGKGGAGDADDDDDSLATAQEAGNAVISSRTQNLVNGANAVIASREAATVPGEPQQLDAAAAELPGTAAESEFEGAESSSGSSESSGSGKPSSSKSSSKSASAKGTSGSSQSSGAASLAQAARQSAEMGEAISNG